MKSNGQSPLVAAAQDFLAQFTALETEGVGMALRALSNDEVFVREAEQLLEFAARLVLLKRLSLARALADDLSAELGLALTRARKLAEHRAALQALLDEAASVTQLRTVRQVKSYTRQAAELTTAMRRLALRMTVKSPAAPDRL